jgi:S-methylmethionine-dependent homocysteine/selenocysteine methylase
MAHGAEARARAAAESKTSLEQRLAAGPFVLLDGAIGTELERRGIACELPLWSSHALLDAPDVLAEIHAEYVAAGAEILTANTFRTQRRTLVRGEAERPGLGERDTELTRRAVEIAREAAGRADHRVFVAGSAPTLEDCYRPDLVPDDASLREEHARHADNLAAAGVDLILVETMNTLREASTAVSAAAATGLPVIVSFVSWGNAELLSGEPLASAIEHVSELAPLAVCVNCGPPSAIEPCLEVLARGASPFGVYANLGEPATEPGAERGEHCGPDQLARIAQSWIAAGARLVGGCCGTTPAHIRALAELR